jgi:septum site-determining protein MinC
VRAGQVVHARDADLLVLATVNAGAQLIADGHIHVYGRLRGRATAGASGRRDARVFCQSLEAELVGIGEQHRVADEIGPKWRGSAAQIWLDGDVLRIGPLL